MHSESFKLGYMSANVDTAGLSAIAKSDNATFENGECVLWAPIDQDLAPLGMQLFADIALYAKSRNLAVTVYYDFGDDNIARYRAISVV